MDSRFLSANNKKNIVSKQYSQGIFYGIGGIRGIFGEHPITLKTMIALGQSLACLIKRRNASMKNGVLIICDTRESCEAMREALAFGLGLHQIQVFDAGVLPTPAATVLMPLFPECEMAVVISASHNSFEYNGLKIFGKTGKISSNDIELLNEFFGFFIQKPILHAFTPPKTLNIKQLAYNFYLQHVIQQFTPNDFAHWPLVIIDCANGAASAILPKICAYLNIKCTIINNTPNGKNINHDSGSTNPQIIGQAVKNQQAAIGFAFDGDADRVVAANYNGKIKDGDDFLAVLSCWTPFNQASTIVGTTMSNSGLESFLSEKGKQFVRSDVGEANLINTAQQYNSPLAGEPSGHILLGHNTTVCDGIIVALSTLKALQETRNFNFHSFNRFFSKLSAISFSKKVDLEDSLITQYVDAARQELGAGRIVLRTSQTEPLLRILVEAEDLNRGKKVSEDITQNLAAIIKKLELNS